MTKWLLPMAGTRAATGTAVMSGGIARLRPKAFTGLRQPSGTRRSPGLRAVSAAVTRILTMVRSRDRGKPYVPRELPHWQREGSSHMCHQGQCLRMPVSACLIPCWPICRLE
jgi:hypothetical protein